MTTLWTLIAISTVLVVGPAVALALLAWLAVVVAGVMALNFAFVALRRILGSLRLWVPLICRWIWSSFRYVVMLAIAPVWGAFGELYFVFRKWMRGNSVTWRAAGMSLLSASVMGLTVWGLAVSSLLFILRVAYETLLPSP